MPWATGSVRIGPDAFGETRPFRENRRLAIPAKGGLPKPDRNTYTDIDPRTNRRDQSIRRTKAMSLSQLAKCISESPTLKLNETAALLREKGEPVIHLGGGEPKSKAPIDAIVNCSSLLQTG